MFQAKKRPAASEFALNITSLMDILTIILIFLIISFSTDESEVTPPDDFKLPMSQSERPVKLAVKLSVGENEVRVEDKVIVRLSGGQFRDSDLDAMKHVVPLLKEMKKQKKRLDTGQLKFASSGEGDEDETQIVYFEAAKGTRSDTVDRVLKTAANAGFVKFRLAVQRKI
jgi:biopolymer transport protein ExbD